VFQSIHLSNLRPDLVEKWIANLPMCMIQSLTGWIIVGIIEHMHASTLKSHNTQETLIVSATTGGLTCHCDWHLCGL